MDLETLAGFALLGLAGSVHCAGMCGGFALAVASRGPSSGQGRRLARTLLFASGKASTYVILGLLLRAGLDVAMGPEHRPWSFSAARRVAAVLAGTVLILQGLFWTGLLRFPAAGTASGFPRLLAAIRIPLARAGSAARSLGGSAGAFATGLVTGFLPCGLSLAAFTLGTQTDPATAAVGLFLFGLATTPSLAAVALGAGLLAPDRRVGVQRALGVAVVLFGLLTMMRGNMGHPMGHGGMDGDTVHAGEDAGE
ncbi:MAG TPA: sulfite exporter TauE/SafE family protein [Planctomycetes bacterium]|nr:sulfite exporter TauE/SafE family protein [Planctomycetota bacterium]